MAYGNTKNRGLFIVLFMRTIALRFTASEVYCPAIADAHRGDGRRFIGRADEKVTAFVELQAATAGQNPA